MCSPDAISYHEQLQNAESVGHRPQLANDGAELHLPDHVRFDVDSRSHFDQLESFVPSSKDGPLGHVQDVLTDIAAAYRG